MKWLLMSLALGGFMITGCDADGLETSPDRDVEDVDVDENDSRELGRDIGEGSRELGREAKEFGEDAVQEAEEFGEGLQEGLNKPDNDVDNDTELENELENEVRD